MAEIEVIAECLARFTKNDYAKNGDGTLLRANDRAVLAIFVSKLVSLDDAAVAHAFSRLRELMDA